MADYGPAEMVQTPWGRADQLRERRLRPGPGLPREEVARSQRERLYAATVASLAAQGYEAVAVADLLELSGVSRSAFYEHFQDKEDCVLATFDTLIGMSMALLERDLAKEGSWRERAAGALRTQLEVIVQLPAVANLCFADIFTVGERGRLAAEQSVAGFAAIAGEAITEIRDGSELPGEMIRGLVGGVHWIIHAHLRRSEVELLLSHAEDLFEWAVSYEAPSEPLRLARRRIRPIEGPPPFVAYSPAERIIRALAAAAGDRGYPAVTIAEIAARASVSQATFYSHFPSKHSALVSALDSAGSQMLGVAMPAARRAADWPSSVRAALGGLCAFYASEPDLARLVAVETYAAGPKAIEQRDRRVAQIRTLIEPGFAAAPGTKPIVADAVLGAVWTLLSAQVVRAGPRSLPDVAPLVSYIVLAPFIGPEEAVRVANGDGRSSVT